LPRIGRYRGGGVCQQGIGFSGVNTPPRREKYQKNGRLCEFGNVFDSRMLRKDYCRRNIIKIIKIILGADNRALKMKFQATI
jgi:hypothetical protein